MFLNSLFAALKLEQIGFQGKSSLLQLSSMDISTIEGRFKMLLTIMSMANSLNFGPMKDGKNGVPDINKIKKIIVQSNSMSHSTIVMSSNLKTVAQELSYEIIEATNGKGDMSIIPDIVNGRKAISDFLNVKENVNLFNKVYSFKGKSGKSYTGKGASDLLNYKADDLKDIILGLNLDKPVEDLLMNAEVMKKEFKNHRNGLMGYVKYCIDPINGEGKVKKFIDSNIFIKEGEETILPKEAKRLSTDAVTLDF